MRQTLPIFGFALLLLFSALAFRCVSGPFYFGNNSDPSYFYLYNFVDLAEGKTPDFVDHPGGPLDLLGAMVVKLCFPPRAATSWFLTWAAHAEDVLNTVWFLLTAVYIATFMGLGFYTLRKSRDAVFTALVLFSGLWLAGIHSFNKPGILPISANVNSDTMMMTAVNLMLWAMAGFYFSPSAQPLWQAVSVGGAVGFAMATKFTALPFLVAGLVLLPTWRQRGLLVLTALAGFVLWTCPIWGSYPHMFRWLKGLVVARGMHGTGGEGFDLFVYLRSFFLVMRQHWMFVAAWIAAGTAATRATETRVRRILWAVALGGLMQVIIVAKQTSFQYMAPMIGLSSLVPAFLYRGFPGWRKALPFGAVLVLIWSLAALAFNMAQVQRTTAKTRAMLTTIQDHYGPCRICPFYRSSWPGFAFVFWNRVLGREEYSAALKQVYPDLVYYDIFGHDFKDSDQHAVPLAALKAQNPCVLMYGSDQDPRNFTPYVTARKIYADGQEALYEPQAAQSNLGLQYLQYAKILAAQGRYEDAYRAAIISRQLGAGEDVSVLIAALDQARQR